MSEFKGPEALSWLTHNRNVCALAGNRFHTTAAAIEAVKRLYAVGATEVYVGIPLDEPERIQREGGPYADALEIVFPGEKTKEVMAVVRSLQPDAGGKMKDIIKKEGGSKLVMLSWD
ncbi:MAG TPA: hypothetical protein VLX56_06245 [Nitrososphaerales archaeon]|nr:hypothetical protein [Nitrososphaerales archaeon]